MDNLLLDKRVKPLGLSVQQKQDLVNFLKSLTGSNIEQLVSDAFAAPVGDVINANINKQVLTTDLANDVAE